MAQINPDHLSPFGRMALKLDQNFSKELLTTRENTEEAAKRVSERALLIQVRKDLQTHMQGKFEALGEKVHQVTAAIADLEVQTADQKSSRSLRTLISRGATS